MAFLSTNLNELQYELRVPTEKILELIEIMHIMGFSSGSDSKESACNAGDPGLIPGWGRSLGEGNGNPLQYYCLEIPWTEEPGRLQFMGSQRVGHD